MIGGASIFYMRRSVFWKSTLDGEWVASKPGLTGFFAVPYTQIEARFARILLRRVLTGMKV